MRVAVFSLAHHPFEGGAEIAAKEIMRRLPYEFAVFTRRFGDYAPAAEKLGNIETIRIGNGSKNLYGDQLGKFFYIFRAWRAAEARHRKEPFTRIWAIMAAYGGASALLFKLRHPQIPFLLTLQEGDSEAHILRRVGILYPLWKMIFKKADYIQAISSYLADFARRHGAGCPIEVVPNGVNVQGIRNQELEIRELKGQKKVVVTTSRLVYKNGINVLIRAADELKKFRISSLEFRILIVGGGPLEQELKRLAKELNVTDVVEFTGQVSAEEIPSYLARADIFVRPSRSEGLGSSFLEAMAAGLPIIGTAVGGIPDFLKPYNPNDANENPNAANGLFININDSHDLAEKLLLLLNEDNLRSRLGSNGRMLVIEKYSWDIVAKKMSNIFQLLTSMGI